MTRNERMRWSVHSIRSSNESMPLSDHPSRFAPFRYVAFKIGLQYVSLIPCSNQILFQYSYDNGIQWFTKRVLDETNNIFEKFDDLSIRKNLHLRWIEDNGNAEPADVRRSPAIGLLLSRSRRSLLSDVEPSIHQHSNGTRREYLV